MSFVHAGYAALIPMLIAGGGLGLWALRSRPARPALTRVARASGLLLTAVTLAVWIGRWIEVEHFPLFGTYENALSLSLSVMLVAVWWERRRGLAVSPASSLIAALLLAQGIQYDAMPYGLTISERSLVVDAHAVIAWLAFGVFAAAAGLAICLACGREGAGLERHLAPLLTLGFVLHTAMIVSGSLYKFMLFGRVWSWDPIETMALIAWLAYGTLLHMALLAGWSARRVARWSVFAFLVLLLSYRAIIWFPAFATYHVFDIGLKLHL